MKNPDDSVRKPKTKQKLLTGSVAHPKDAPNDSSQAVKAGKGRKMRPVPVLRTYENDTSRLARDKGGAELRAILAREMEEKKKAQEEYAQKTRELMKESAVLQSMQKDAKRSEVKKEKRAAQESVNMDIRETVSGAAAYMQGVLTQEDTKKEPPAAPPEPPSPEKDVKPVRSRFGFLRRQKGTENPSEVFTDSERKKMQRQQENIVEKEKMRETWKDFQVKKEKLREQGLRARDIRSYGPEKIKRSSFQQRDFFIAAIVFIILAGLIITILSIATRPEEVPGFISPEELESPRNVITGERRILVDLSNNPEEWRSIIQSQAGQYTASQFVPYMVRDGENIHLNIAEFSDYFSMNLPQGLLNTLNEYYFVGNYATESAVNGFMILSVKNFEDAFVWLLNWEKQLLNAFSAVFPNTLIRTRVESVTVQKKTIDNKEVRIVRNEGEGRLLYYFFNRSLLVIIVGEEDAVQRINNRIRSANSQ